MKFFGTEGFICDEKPDGSYNVILKSVNGIDKEYNYILYTGISLLPKKSQQKTLSFNKDSIIEKINKIEGIKEYICIIDNRSRINIEQVYARLFYIKNTSTNSFSVYEYNENINEFNIINDDRFNIREIIRFYYGKHLTLEDLYGPSFRNMNLLGFSSPYQKNKPLKIYPINKSVEYLLDHRKEMLVEDYELVYSDDPLFESHNIRANYAQILEELSAYLSSNVKYLYQRKQIDLNTMNEIIIDISFGAGRYSYKIPKNM